MTVGTERLDAHEQLAKFKNVELRMAANEHSEETITLEETASIVDQTLQETLTALLDVLGSEYEYEQSERDSWWAGYPE
jgi:hypothetical protein